MDSLNHKKKGLICMKNLRICKKIIVAALALMLAISCFTTTAFAEEVEPEWYFGGNTFDVQDPIVKQGYKGWYYLYSLSYNTKGAFPLNSFKECDQNLASGKWKVPDSEGLPKGDIEWFGPRKDGYLGVGNKVSACLKWVVPKDGNYILDFAYAGGTNTPNDVSDGVIFYLYHNDKLLATDETQGYNRVPEGSKYQGELSLKAGEAFYCIVDPKENSNADDSWWFISITDAAKVASDSSSANTSNDNTQAPTSSAPMTDTNSNDNIVSPDTTITDDDSSDSTIDNESTTGENSIDNVDGDVNDNGANGLVVALIIIVGVLLIILIGGVAAFFIFASKKGLFAKNTVTEASAEKIVENDIDSDE